MQYIAGRWKSVIALCIAGVIVGTPMYTAVRAIREPLAVDDGGWKRTFGGPETEWGHSVAETADGGYIIAGDTHTDVWLIKTDGQGVMEWNRTYGGSYRDRGWSVQPTRDGGYIIAGEKGGGADRQDDVWLIKTDGQGVMEWNRTYGGSLYDGARSVMQTLDGGYILVGWKDAYYGQGDIWVIKTTADGGMTWNTTIGGAGRDLGYAICPSHDNGYMVAGFVAGEGGCLIKVDGQGSQEWHISVADEISAVQPTVDGGYILTGSVNQGGPPYAHTDMLLVKTDSEGSVQWQRSFGTFHYEHGQSVVQTSDGGFLLAGHTVAVRSTQHTGSLYDIWLIKTDGEGDERWMKRLGGSHYEHVSAVIQTSDDTYLLVGDTYSYGAGGYDVWLVKTGVPEVTIELDGIWNGCTVANTGERDLADISWSIDVDGMVLFGGHTAGTIDLLPAGETATIGMGFTFGFGPVWMVITAAETAAIAPYFLIGNIIVAV